MSRDRGRSAQPVSDDSWRSILAGANRLTRRAIARRLAAAESAAERPTASGTRALPHDAPQDTAPSVASPPPARPAVSRVAAPPRPPARSGPPAAEEVSTRWLWWTAIILGAAAPFAAGLRVRERSWAIGGGALLVVEVLGLVLNGGADGPTTPLRDFGTGLFAVGWFTGIAFVAAFRGRYRTLVRASSQLEQREAVHSERNAERARARDLASTDPAEALRRGVGRPDLPGADHGWVVDVNHAPASVLETLPGVEPDLARRIVATRESVGLASAVDDLALMLDLDHRTVERLRATAVAVEI